MRLLVLVVLLLAQNQAAPVSRLQDEQHLLLMTLQAQVAQTTPSAPTDAGQQKTSSSSSSSSSSVSSESDESSEGKQMMRERLNLENAAVEHMDSSQESPELFQPLSNTSTPLWLRGIVHQGDASQDREDDTQDDSAEPHHRALLLTFHPLLTRSRPDLTATREAGRSVTGDMGGARGAKLDQEFPILEHDDRLTFDMPGHYGGYHGNRAGLELVL